MQKRDVLVLMLLVVALIVAGTGAIDNLLKTTMASSLPYFEFRTLLRIFCALFLSIVIGIPVGLGIAMNKRFGAIALPIVDVLQSAPVLAYVPPLLFFFGASNVADTQLKLEIISILLLFTGMVWAVILNTMGGYQTIPEALKDAMCSFKILRLSLFKHLILPAIYPAVVTGGITAMGGGWYFIVAAEYINFGKNATLGLPGIGYFLAKMTYEQANISAAVFGLAILVTTIYIINKLFWKPLIEYSEHFNYETIGAQEILPTKFLKILGKKYAQFMDFLIKIDDSFCRKSAYLPLKKTFELVMLIFLFAILALYSRDSATIIGEFATKMYQEFGKNITVSQLLLFSAASIVRLTITYIIAVIISLAIGRILWRNKKANDVVMPLLDIFQSTPALALFPIIIYFAIGIFNNNQLAIEFASIILMLTGMLWYLLFNMISAINDVPEDVIEAGRAYGLQKNSLFFRVVVPATLPRLVVASMQAFGGGWNASIVSEYIQLGNKVLVVPGLGMILDTAFIDLGSAPLVGVSIITLMMIIIITNRLVWKRLLAKMERYKFV